MKDKDAVERPLTWPVEQGDSGPGIDGAYPAIAHAQIGRLVHFPHPD